jgi:hypothetical protein
MSFNQGMSEAAPVFRVVNAHHCARLDLQEPEPAEPDSSPCKGGHMRCTLILRRRELLEKRRQQVANKYHAMHLTDPDGPSRRQRAQQVALVHRSTTSLSMCTGNSSLIRVVLQHTCECVMA